MEKRKKTTIKSILYWGLVTAAPVITATVLAWIFSLAGTLGMYRWLPPFQYIIIFLGILGILVPLLGILGRKRRAFRVIAVVLGIPGLLIPLLLGGVYLVGSLQFAATTAPVLLIADGTGAKGVPNLALVFRSAQPTQNTLYFGVDALDQKVNEPAPVREHVLALKDLKPGVHYQWRLNEGTTCGFTTPAAQPSGDLLYHFAVGSDSHLSGSTASSLAPAGDPTVLHGVSTYVTTAKDPFHAFFLTGDFVNMGQSYQDWQFALDKISPLTCTVPMRSVMGNHDSYFDGEPQYLAYLYPPGMETQTGSRLYYRIDAGKVHFFMLNMLWGVDTFSAQERDWLETQLASIPAGDWKIVMEHSMVYASGNINMGKQYYDPIDMVQQVAPLFEKYKVNLVVTGHDHHLEFLQKNGVSYAIVGGMGAPLDAPSTHISTSSVWNLPLQYGFLDATVRSSQIELHFRDPKGNELKSFTIQK